MKTYYSICVYMCVYLLSAGFLHFSFSSILFYSILLFCKSKMCCYEHTDREMFTQFATTIHRLLPNQMSSSLENAASLSCRRIMWYVVLQCEGCSNSGLQFENCRHYKFIFNLFDVRTLTSPLKGC